MTGAAARCVGRFARFPGRDQTGGAKPRVSIRSTGSDRSRIANSKGRPPSGIPHAEIGIGVRAAGVAAASAACVRSRSNDRAASARAASRIADSAAVESVCDSSPRIAGFHRTGAAIRDVGRAVRRCWNVDSARRVPQPAGGRIGRFAHNGSRTSGAQHEDGRPAGPRPDGGGTGGNDAQSSHARRPRAR